MKPGKNDIAYSIRISGAELDVLKEIMLGSVDDYGLGGRIEKYLGTRSIRFWGWDLDCLEATFQYEDRRYGEFSKKPYDDRAYQSLKAMIEPLIRQASIDRPV
jgi:hypothetical protein